MERGTGATWRGEGTEIAIGVKPNRSVAIVVTDAQSSFDVKSTSYDVYIDGKKAPPTTVPDGVRFPLKRGTHEIELRPKK